MRSEYIRNTRPAGPPIPKIRLLGTSWYRRGVGYWARRAGLSLLYLLLLAMVLLVVGAVVSAIVSATTGWTRVAILAAVALVVLASYVHAVRALVLRRRARRQGGAPLTAAQRRDLERRRRRGGAAGLGTGGATLAGSTVGGAFLLVGSLAVVGLASTIVVDSLGKYLSDEEFYAAQGIARWRAQHPDWRP